MPKSSQSISWTPNICEVHLKKRRQWLNLIQVELKSLRGKKRGRNPRDRIAESISTANLALKNHLKISIASKITKNFASFDSIEPIFLVYIAKTTLLLLWRTPSISVGLSFPLAAPTLNEVQPTFNQWGPPLDTLVVPWYGMRSNFALNKPSLTFGLNRNIYMIFPFWKIKKING